MAANITCANANNSQIEPHGQFVKELVAFTGASTAAGDTGSYVTMIDRPLGVEGGAFKASISGKTVTVTAVGAIGTGTVYAYIYGY